MSLLPRPLHGPWPSLVWDCLSHTHTCTFPHLSQNTLAPLPVSNKLKKKQTKYFTIQPIFHIYFSTPFQFYIKVIFKYLFILPPFSHHWNCFLKNHFIDKSISLFLVLFLNLATTTGISKLLRHMIEWNPDVHNKMDAIGDMLSEVSQSPKKRDKLMRGNT